SSFQIVSQEPGVANPGAMVLDPAGNTLTVTNASRQEVSTMSVNTSSGKLSFQHSTPSRPLPVSVVMSTGVQQTGYAPRMLLVGGTAEQHLRAYQIDEATGALTQTGTPGG